MRIVTVLRSGGEYGSQHVTRLQRMVPGHDFVCLTDTRVDCAALPLRHDWPGWWAKMELFAPWVTGDLLYFDLDTTVFKVPTEPERTTVLRDFYHPAQIGSGLMYLKEADRAEVWDEFVRDPARHMRECTTRARWGDQGFIAPFFQDAARWQDIARVYSYKVHCRRGVPRDAEVVCFHGQPRPWAIPELTLDS